MYDAEYEASMSAEQRASIALQEPGFLKQLKGATEEEAMRIVKSRGGYARVSSRNGRGFAGGADCQQNRVNLSVRDGVVTGASLG